MHPNLLFSPFPFLLHLDKWNSVFLIAETQILEVFFPWQFSLRFIIQYIIKYSWLHLLEKAMAPHSSTLAWKTPWMEEPGRLQSMGSLRVRHDWATSLSLFTSMIGEGNGNPHQCSCLENPRDGEAWWAAVYGVAQSRTRLKWLSSSSMTPSLECIENLATSQPCSSASFISCQDNCSNLLMTLSLTLSQSSPWLHPFASLSIYVSFFF